MRIVTNNIRGKFEFSVFLISNFAKESLISKVEGRKFGELNRMKTFKFLLLGLMSFEIANEVVF